MSPSRRMQQARACVFAYLNIRQIYGRRVYRTDACSSSWRMAWRTIRSSACCLLVHMICVRGDLGSAASIPHTKEYEMCHVSLTLATDTDTLL